MITTLRIGMAAVAAGLAVFGEPRAAVGTLIAAALLDAFDGWYARRSGQCSALGAHLDPLADKILMGVVFAWVGIDAASPWVWALVALVALRETGVTLLRAYSLRRRGRFIPASRFGRVKMLTQSIVGLVVLSVTHFLGRAVTEAVVVVGLTGVLVVSYVSAAGYVSRWRHDEYTRRSKEAGPDGQPHEERRVSAGW